MFSVPPFFWTLFFLHPTPRDPPFVQTLTPETSTLVSVLVVSGVVSEDPGVVPKFRRLETSLRFSDYFSNNSPTLRRTTGLK